MRNKLLMAMVMTMALLIAPVVNADTVIERMSIGFAGQAAASASNLLNAIDVSASSTISWSTWDTTFTSQPLCARNLVFKLTDADSGVSTDLDVTVTVVGKDQWGNTQTITYDLDNNDTATGRTCWSHITSVSYAASGYGASDLFYMGFGNRVGLITSVAASTQIFKTVYDSTPEARGTMDISQYNGYTPSSTLAADKLLVVFIQK